MKKVLSFDVDQTLNIAKTPIPEEIAELLIKCLKADFKICPISGQKFDQFLVQIVNPLLESGATVPELMNLHLFVAQGTQYYRYDPLERKEGIIRAGVFTNKTPYDEKNWVKIYDYPLKPAEVEKITEALETAAKELGLWEEDKLKPGDEIIENRLSQVTFSALGQKAGTKEKYAWDPDCKKREKIVKKAKALAPEFDYEIGGTTSINAIKPGMNKKFGMENLLKELKVKKSDILYFGDMTNPGGNDYPVVEMGIDTQKISVIINGSCALRKIDDKEKKVLRTKLGISDKTAVLVFCARLEKCKGHEWFMNAVKCLCDKNVDFKALIVGDGSQREALIKLCRKLGVFDKVIFCGFSNDVAPFMNIADININCSIGTETSSLSLSEGMSLGLPAVVSDYGGNPYMVRHGVNGFVCTQGDYLKMSEYHL